MTEVQQNDASGLTGPTARPPLGVTVIAAACLVAAGVLLALALLSAVAPAWLQAYGFADTSSASARFGLTTVLTASAVLVFAAGYDLLRLDEGMRRALVPLLVMLAATEASGVLGEGLLLRLIALIVVAACAVYLTRPGVKAAFAQKAAGAIR